jgi:pyruvate dehydrogenase E1 component alpha subunit
MNYSKELLLALYKTMLRIRICEESFVEPILNGEIRCPVHLYSGEEAVATGVCANLEKTDYIFGTHRSHGHFLAKGGSMKELAAEIYGKETGCSRGRGGSMHLIDIENGMLGAAPIVGGTISLALGSALSTFVRNDKRVTVAFFGDGATGEGALHESLNFASLKNLPLIFVCENNLYSTHMPILEIRNNENIYEIANPYKIPTYRIDGNDVLKVYETAKEATTICRSGNGPVFIETLTYRFRGHVGPDDNIQGSHTDIRPKEEIEKWIKYDPIQNLQKYLLGNNICNNGELENLHNLSEKEVIEATEFALKSKKSPKEELYHYVFK